MWHFRKHRPRWVYTDQVITQWLKERQALLVSFYELCGTQNHPQRFNPEHLQTFCELLIDYVSVGHFKIFERLAEAKANSVENPKLDQKLLGDILQSTHAILDFNDKYEKESIKGILAEDLSTLGHNLAHRLDLEDQLIHHYLEFTTEQKNSTPPPPRAMSM